MKASGGCQTGLLRESLKWMLVTLLIAFFVVIGIIVAPTIRDAVSARRDAAIVTPLPTVTPVPTPVPTSTPAPTATPSPVPTATPVTLEAWLTEYVVQMSVQDKLGQMALFGFSGTHAPGSGYVENQQNYHVGNIILYGANISSGNGDGGFAQCAGLIESARETVPGEIPPFVAIDIEGGSVTRFHWPTWPLSGRSLGKREPGFAYEQFYNIGQKLLSTGINVNLAPVLDVMDNANSTFFRTRIISGDAEVVTRIGTAIIEGLHDSGCMATAKHFPGHGGTTRDSHDTTPVVELSADALASRDLVPFAAAIDSGVDIVLVAHILYPALDESDIASMSEPVITGLLREQMGFTGVVMSDDFRMGGLTSRYSAGDAAVRFVQAGGDLIMCGAQYDRQAAIMRGLTEAVEDGTISEARINESVYRILLKKIERGVWNVEGRF